MRVTVFGGSAPKPDTTPYQQAYQLGQIIGENGHIAITGGYIGTMEAVSRGCAEAGGHVIGVTCDEIESWRPVKPNRWVAEEIRLPKINDRLVTLIETCDLAFALPGGVGTLAEIAMMWNQMQTEAIPARPLVLVGLGWQQTFNVLFDRHPVFIPQKHREYLSFAQDVSAAAKYLTG
jgi:uncharacterized protein (TIGR00725 family)